LAGCFPFVTGCCKDMNSIRPLLFIAGNSRSGTTMLSRIMGRNSLFFSFRELHFFETLYSPGKQLQQISEPEAVAMTARLLDIQRRGVLAKRQVSDYFAEAKALVSSTPSNTYHPTTVFLQFLSYETRREQKQAACEQTPKNVFYIEEILKLSEHSLVLNIVRDPRDVLLSQKNRWRRRYLSGGNIPFRAAARNWVNYSPILTSRIWCSSVRAGDQYSGNSRVMTIRFEDILRNPEEAIRSVCDFVGVPFEPEMLEVENRGSSNQSDDRENAGIDRSKGGQWRNGSLGKTEIYICQKISVQEMVHHGYEFERIRPNYLVLLTYILFLPFQLLLVIIINYRRFSRIFASIKRRFL
jgi:hypothetical protein